MTKDVILDLKFAKERYVFKICNMHDTYNHKCFMEWLRWVCICICICMYLYIARFAYKVCHLSVCHGNIVCHGILVSYSKSHIPDCIDVSSDIVKNDCTSKSKGPQMVRQMQVCTSRFVEVLQRKERKEWVNRRFPSVSY